MICDVAHTAAFAVVGDDIKNVFVAGDSAHNRLRPRTVVGSPIDDVAHLQVLFKCRAPVSCGSSFDVLLSRVPFPNGCAEVLVGVVHPLRRRPVVLNARSLVFEQFAQPRAALSRRQLLEVPYRLLLVRLQTQYSVGIRRRQHARGRDGRHRHAADRPRRLGGSSLQTAISTANHRSFGPRLPGRAPSS